jgi:PUA-domain protein
MEFRLRNRARLRRKEVEELARQLGTALGLSSTFAPEDPLEVAEGPDRRYLLLRNEIVGFYEGDRPFLSPKGLLKWPATKRYVTVDMGAVRFVTNGADVMGPGITDADPEIRPEDLVWIREERHGKPLGVGVALSEASVLRAKAKGKQVRALLHVGDKAWTYGEEEEKPEADEGASA